MTEEEALADTERLIAFLQAKIDAWDGDARDSWVRDRWVHNRDAIRRMDQILRSRLAEAAAKPS